MASTDPILSALRNLESNLVERLTAEMDRRFDDARREMNGRFDAIEKRLERRSKVSDLEARLHEIEERLADE